jgi:hypothetical protein
VQTVDASAPALLCGEGTVGGAPLGRTPLGRAASEVGKERLVRIKSNWTCEVPSGWLSKVRIGIGDLGDLYKGPSHRWGRWTDEACVEGLEERHRVEQRLDHLPGLDRLSVRVLGFGSSPLLHLRLRG